MAERARGAWLRLIDRKPITRRTKRFLTRPERPTFAAELEVAFCHATDFRPVGKLVNTKPFDALLDTGCNFEGMLSRGHFEGFCEPRYGFDELKEPEKDDKITIADGERRLLGKLWDCDVWIFPFGSADITEPIRVPLGGPVRVFPPPADSAVIGMGILRQLRARLSIDFDEEVFSILVSEEMLAKCAAEIAPDET